MMCDIEYSPREEETDDKITEERKKNKTNLFSLVLKLIAVRLVDFIDQ
jgi:hypothetical protein